MRVVMPRAILDASHWESASGQREGQPVEAVAEAARVERERIEIPGEIWLLSRRNAILAAVPFAAFGAWTEYLVALSLYAGASLFFVQHVNHRLAPELTPR